MQEGCWLGPACVKRMPQGLPLSEEDWTRTPAAVQAVVIALGQQVQALQAQVAALRTEVAQLREQLRRNSQNSSQPPSADPPNAPTRPKRTPSGRPAGGQHGHAGQGRKLMSVEDVDQVVDLKPISCAGCGALLLGEDTQPVRHQVTELPRVEADVTEYRQHTLTCLACGAQTPADWPADMPSGSFGPRVQATVGYLTGHIGARQRDVEEMLDTLFHTDLSLGSIPAQEDQVSAALAEPINAVTDYVQHQPIQNVDETSWREKQKRSWLGIDAAPLVTLFLLMATRGAKWSTALSGRIAGRALTGSTQPSVNCVGRT